jgi:hypothetical protein
MVTAMVVSSVILMRPALNVLPTASKGGGTGVFHPVLFPKMFAGYPE